MADNLQKHTLNLRRGDWDFIESIFKPKGIPTSQAVRSLISHYVDAKRREVGAAEAPKLDQIDINI